MFFIFVLQIFLFFCSETTIYEINTSSVNFIKLWIVSKYITNKIDSFFLRRSKLHQVFFYKYLCVRAILPRSGLLLREKFVENIVCMMVRSNLYEVKHFRKIHFVSFAFVDV